MKRNLFKNLLPLMLALGVLPACTDSEENGSGYGGQVAAVDAGPAFTDKLVDVNRDGQAYGQVAIRFYSDMPNVPYISVVEFHRIMTGGKAMNVQRQGDIYELTTSDGMATVDVKSDCLWSTSYAGFVNLAWMTDASFPPNAMHDGNKYLKILSIDTPSMFKSAGNTRLDFKKYAIDLHDDGSNVFYPFATLADMYADCNFHYAACHDDKVMVSTTLDVFTMNTIDANYASKPYQRSEVPADMAKYRYQELCFVFDNLFGYPGVSMMEQNDMAQKGFDATLDVVENGPLVKRLLQSANNIDFAWGRNALQYLLFDGGHTNVRATVGVPSAISQDFGGRITAAAGNYPEASALFGKWSAKINERNRACDALSAARKQAYGDVIYKANSQKTLGVIILDSFNDMDEEAWTKYYSSQKGDANWQELMQSYKKDNLIGFLYGLEQAKADGVKNLLIDISVNGGGSTDIVAACVALLRKNRTVQFWSQDVLEGKNKIATYYVDTNFDGVFDEKDDSQPKVDCSGMKIGVLSSKGVFSCGNQFATLMKDYGYPIMGERSGGGSCCIQVMLTPDGQHYIMSTYRDRSTDKNFGDVDAGIAPTDGYAFDYAKFCDLDFLNSKF